VVMKPRSTRNASFSTLTIGATQLVVQDASLRSLRDWPAGQ
jgi:hypothetical protein